MIMGGNVSIVNVGQTDEQKRTLLAGVGLNESTIRHCLAGNSYKEPAPGIVTGPAKPVVTIVPRPEIQPYGGKTKIAGPQKVVAY
jgi:hypothetical protein